jgi:hypothetical protein
MREFIVEFCETIGPREPCSSEERAASKLFQEKMKKHCEDVVSETFLTHPGAYKAAFRVPMVLYFISLVLYWLIPWLSLIVSILLIIILIGEMTLAKEVIDFLFPKKSSQNIVSKIKPKNQAKTLIIIGSHIDSNWEFPLIRRFGNKFPIIIGINWFLNFILLLLLIVKNFLILTSFEAFIIHIELVFFIIFIITIPIPFTQLFFIISNRPVMGANDNLSGMAVCHELAKILSLPENKPKNVEIWINAYGCEEIGAKGSKAFVKAHFNEIKNAKIINIDMVGFKNSPLIIKEAEIQGFVKMDENMINILKESGDKLQVKVIIIPSISYTDSLSFCRRNLSATSLGSTPQSGKEYYYHTRYDVIENMTFENLVNAYNICMDVIKRLDN